MQMGVKVLMGLMVFAVFTSCAVVKQGVAPRKVRSGLDVMGNQDFAPLKGKRVAVITNHSALDHRGQHMLDLMQKSKNVNIVALFAPEHGFMGTADRSLENQKDEKSGMTIYSLYGKTNRPTKEMLKDVEVLVFDIQDIGARFYTYISTLAMCMEEAKKSGIKFIVLDHPNPITGLGPDGPIQDEDLFGKFTSYFPMPVKHAMTIGELALMFNDHFGIGCDLEVVKMERWKRTMYFDETGEPWVNPSPNIRNVAQEILYPGFAMTEGTNISVGRGTDTPFEIYGAPYINAEQLTQEMRSRNLPGLQFEPVSFTPTSSRFEKQQCNGFRVKITDRNAVKIVPAGLHLIDALQKLYPDTYKIQETRGLVGSQAVVDMIKARKPVPEIIESYQGDLREFMQIREKYLLYE